jgi:hypothetical protein
MGVVTHNRHQAGERELSPSMIWALKSIARRGRNEKKKWSQINLFSIMLFIFVCSLYFLCKSWNKQNFGETFRGAVDSGNCVYFANLGNAGNFVEIFIDLILTDIPNKRQDLNLKPHLYNFKGWIWFLGPEKRSKHPKTKIVRGR